MGRKNNKGRSRRIPQTAGMVLNDKRPARPTPDDYHFCPQNGYCNLPEGECEQLRG